MDKDTEVLRKTQNRKTLTAILITAAITVSFFLGYFVCFFARSEESRKFDEIKDIIDKQGITVEDLDADDIAKAMRKILLANDPYAEYFTAEEYAETVKNNAGSYSGFGFAITADGEIARVYWNSPAHKGGIKEGDILLGGKLAEDAEFTFFAPTEGRTFFDNTSEFFAGIQNGDGVVFKVERNGEEIDFPLVKEAYEMSYVLYADSEKGYEFSSEDDGFKGRETENGIAELAEDTAYIRLTAFEGGAGRQFGEAVKFMEDRGRTKLVLDLRDNGGGLLTVLIEVASYIVNDNDKDEILITNVKEKDRGAQYYTYANNFYSGLTNICVIANCNTASASECLIGALMSYGNAATYKGANFNYDNLIITTKHPERETYSTYGKGIMQTTYLLKTGGALKLTTAELFWPVSSISIQGTGVIQENPLNQVSDAVALSRAAEILSAYS